MCSSSGTPVTGVIGEVMVTRPTRGTAVFPWRSPCLARPPAPSALPRGPAADPGHDRPRRRVPGRRARQRGHAGQLHRLRLRPVPGTRPEGDERLAEELAVPGRRHLHLRRLARLPQPAQPDPAWVTPSCARAGGCCRSRSARRRSCSPRFPRYGNDETIKPKPGDNGMYRHARKQGSAEATDAVAAAKALGIVPGSTLWYDLEGFDHSNRHCRESAMAFLSAWTERLHQLDYVSGVYSSVGSGIKMLDDARVERPGKSRCPTGSGWPAGTGSRTPARRTSARTAGAPAAGSSSTWAATTRPGAACGSTSTATSSTSARARGPRPRPTAAGSRSTSRDFMQLAGDHGHRPDAGPPVPAQGAGRVRRQGQRQLQRRPRSRRPAPGRQAHGFTAQRHLVPAELDEPGRRRPARRSSSSAPPVPTYAASSAH